MLLPSPGSIRQNRRCSRLSIVRKISAFPKESDKEEAEAAKLVGVMQTMLPLVKAEQSRALAVVTLYGCTDSSIYYHLAHEAVDPWKKEGKPKKSKQQLINRLDDYDRWLRH